MAAKAHLPTTRVATIMKSCSEVEIVNKESTYILTKATEMFIRQLAEEGYKTTNNGKKLDYKNVADVVHREERYDFLRDIMPKKITVAEFKKIMAKKEAKNEDGTSSDSEDESSSSSSDGSESSSEDKSGKSED